SGRPPAAGFTLPGVARRLGATQENNTLRTNGAITITPPLYASAAGVIVMAPNWPNTLFPLHLAVWRVGERESAAAQGVIVMAPNSHERLFCLGSPSFRPAPGHGKL